MEFMKTLKYEEVLRNEYRNLAEARASMSFLRHLLEMAASRPHAHTEHIDRV